MCKTVKEPARDAAPRCLPQKPIALTAVLCWVYTKFFLTFFTAHKTSPLQEGAGTDHWRQEATTDSWLQQIKLVSRIYLYLLCIHATVNPILLLLSSLNSSLLMSLLTNSLLLLLFILVVSDSLIQSFLLQVNFVGLDGNNNKNTN